MSLKIYIAKRILIAIPILFIISVFSFSLIYLAPGDPVDSILGPRSAGNKILAAQLREIYKLDQPVYIQYFNWLSKAIRLDFGYSYIRSERVSDLMKDRIKNTLILTITATFFQLFIGILFGIVSAVKHNSLVDRFLTVLSFLGMSIPVVGLGGLMIWVFAVKLGWFPSGGLYDVVYGGGVLDRLQHLFMPALVLAVLGIAQNVRYTRSAMLDVINRDYVTTARAKGLGEKTVIYKHALKNAMLPIITVNGFLIPALFGGAVITETLFSWPGMGRLTVNAALSNDYTVLMASTMFFAILTVISILVVDILYAWIDPRIKYG